MKRGIKFNLLAYSTMIMILLFSCKETTWLKECDKPYLTLDDLIANKNYLFSKYTEIEMSRPKIWSKYSEDYYEFRDFKKCRASIKYINGEWKYWGDHDISCDKLKGVIFDCRRICDSLQIRDLKFIKGSKNYYYLFGYNVKCVDVSSFVNNQITLEYKYLYLTNNDSSDCYSTGMSPCIYSFFYKDQKFCLCKN